MNLKEWNQMQVDEALSDVNRYFFWQKYGRSGNDEELMRYYCQCGGASGFAKRHAKFRDETKTRPSRKYSGGLSKDEL